MFLLYRHKLIFKHCTHKYNFATYYLFYNGVRHFLWAYYVVSIHFFSSFFTTLYFQNQNETKFRRGGMKSTFSIDVTLYITTVKRRFGHHLSYLVWHSTHLPSYELHRITTRQGVNPTSWDKVHIWIYISCQELIWHTGNWLPSLLG